MIVGLSVKSDLAGALLLPRHANAQSPARVPFLCRRVHEISVTEQANETTALRVVSMTVIAHGCAFALYQVL